MVILLTGLSYLYDGRINILKPKILIMFTWILYEIKVHIHTWQDEGIESTNTTKTKNLFKAKLSTMIRKKIHYKTNLNRRYNVIL